MSAQEMKDLTYWDQKADVLNINCFVIHKKIILLLGQIHLQFTLLNKKSCL